MKLNLTPQLNRRLSGRAWLIRLVAFTLLLLPLFTNAQGQKTLKIEKSTLERAIANIRTTYGVVIAYNKSDIQAVEIAGGEFKNISADQLLETVLKGSGFTYQKNGSSYVVLKSPSPKSPNASAGQGPGTIKGRIVEFESSQPLPGASVYIVELQKGMQSNNDGYYKFSSIPAGKYTLKVSYISYTTETIQVEIKADKEETFDIKMRGSNSLSEVVVSGTKKTRAPVSHTTDRQVLAEIKNSQSVVSGISSEQISKSADRNAADVVRRVAGVTVRDDKFVIIRGMNERYNLTYLNGNIAPSTELYSRAFSMDLIPTRIIDRILIYKSAAPDLLGDMTGGAVKIYTKDAKNVKHFDLEFQTGYRENTTFNKNFLTYQGGKFDFLGFDDGLRKLPSSVPKFGDFTKANISQNVYAESFSNVLNYGKKTALPLMQLTANYYNSFKLAGKSLSTLTSLSYKNEPQHQDVDRRQGNVTYPESTNPSEGTLVSRISSESQNTEVAQLSLLQNFTWHLSDSSNLYFKNFLLQQGQNTTILRNSKTNQAFIDGEFKNFNPANKDLRDIIMTYSQRFLYSGNLGGSHYIGKKDKHRLEWNGGYTLSRLDLPDQRAIHLQNNVRGQDGITTVGDYEQNWVPVFRNQDQNTPSLNASELGMISRTWTRNKEQVYNGSADYTYKFKPWVTLKAGMYQSWKQREVFRRVYTVNEGDLNSDGSYDFTNPAIGANGKPMDYNIVFFRQQQLGEVWSNKYLRDDGSGLKVFDRTAGSDAYVATEQNNSGYIAASLLPFNGKLDIYGGLRVEYNRQKVAGALLGDINVPVLADLKGTLFLPSLNIGYRPDSNLVVRAAYGRTVNRPEFRELSPYSELDYLNNQSIQGNSNLLFATVNNYDLRFEWYPGANKKGESISLGGFYKDITNPIERVIYKSNSANIGQTPTFISFINADKAKVYGVELDIRKNLDFLPGGLFRDLSVIANGTWVYSKATREKRSENNDNSSGDVNIDRQLQGQAPYAVNAGLYYENAGRGTKIGLIFNQVGPRIYAASIGAPATFNGQVFTQGDQGSLIELSRRQLDLSITQRVIKSLQAKLSVQNLLNSPVQMAEDANFTYKYEKATLRPQGSATTSSFNGDLLSSDYKPGRFFLLTFTYGF